ncbi:hypothetical protein EYF80_001879 [Liparis tanakae]|uniref:Uncharacterized protein n=1 Tax=Liparis tanakae TaxID=230148 RepID=A0A4Z2JC81_9TELE|nr:hypothetical protein EYF80_001879 [Liparis tanakae]
MTARTRDGGTEVWREGSEEMESSSIAAASGCIKRPSRLCVSVHLSVANFKFCCSKRHNALAAQFELHAQGALVVAISLTAPLQPALGDR